jgi:hypothetical protein
LSTQILKITDSDGDSLFVRDTEDTPSSSVVFVKLSSHSGVYLTPADVGQLRDALAPYDTRRAVLNPTPFLHPSVGDTVRLLPGATRVGGYSPAFDAGVTRVVVAEGLDGDGDYRVRAANGTSDRGMVYIAAKFLAPLEMLGDDLDPRRVRAMEMARETIGLVGAPPSTDSVLKLAEFLLGGDAA